MHLQQPTTLHRQTRVCVCIKLPWLNCRICRCRTTGAAVHVTQLSEFLWLPSPSQLQSDVWKSAHNDILHTILHAESVCANSQGFFAHSTPAHKKERAEWHSIALLPAVQIWRRANICCMGSLCNGTAARLQYQKCNCTLAVHILQNRFSFYCCLVLKWFATTKILLLHMQFQKKQWTKNTHVPITHGIFWDKSTVFSKQLWVINIVPHKNTCV